MKKRIVFGFVFGFCVFILTTTSAPKSSNILDISSVSKESVFVLKGEVAPETLKMIPNMEKVSKKNNDTIYLIINSPGGNVVIGHVFLNAMHGMKARGTKFVCVAPVIVASMAFHILSECNDRIIMPSTLLLFHEGRQNIMGALTPSDMKISAEKIERLVNSLERKLKEKLNVSDEVFDYHNKNETLWLGEDFELNFPGFIRIVDNIELPEDIEFTIYDLE